MDPNVEIYKALWDNIDIEIRNKLNSGIYVSNQFGTITDRSSGKIIANVPFSKVFEKVPENSTSLLNISNEIQALQTAMTGAVALSTVVIMGTVIACTAYLANKIDKLQQSISALQKEIHDQNVLFYVEKISHYFGAVEALREVSSSDDVIVENQNFVLLHLANLSAMRNQTFYFSSALIELSDGFSPDGKKLAIDFINNTMDLMPKAIYIEAQAAHRAHNPLLGDRLFEQASNKYLNLKESYRSWANEKVRLIHEGKIDSGEAIVLSQKNDIKQVLESEENRILLDFAV